MIRIGVKSDIDKLVASLSAFDETQLPYTIALALTRTAQDARAEVTAAMPGEFILRRTWILQGIRIKAARKDNLVATVYSRDPFMARQEYGGNKVSMDGGRNIAIPLAARPDPRALIPEELLPANLGRAEYTISKNGNLVTKKGTGGAAFRMVSNGKTYLALRTAAGLKMMYLLVPSAHITPRLNLGEITQRVVRERFAENFLAAAREAMATRRVGGTLRDS
ncbi:hypothetical protein [Acidocella facilis]|uniref:hypothetical protein n=1 Tax=Acidocella facilis TaxID=525 RepID=UPI001F469C22|nr:hypothetical protein [Acidocella facilis]